MWWCDICIGKVVKKEKKRKKRQKTEPLVRRSKKSLKNYTDRVELLLFKYNNTFYAFWLLL